MAAQQNTKAKTPVSADLFKKKVECEYEQLRWLEYKSNDEAWRQATETVKAEFEIDASQK